MKKILLTNDDGLFSEGLRWLKESLSDRYDITVVAPDRERSGISMSLTINHPLRMRTVGEKEYMIDGTPADCINIALQKVLTQSPDFIVSGMNLGENLSEDVLFSGTVAGAFSGYLYGIPALAVSLLGRKSGSDGGNSHFNLKGGAEITGRVLDKLISLEGRVAVYNLNIPYQNNGEIVATLLGNKNYQPTIVEREDPRGKRYYWIGSGNPSLNGKEGTDLEAVNQGKISLSVLNYDLNSEAGKEELSRLFNED